MDDTIADNGMRKAMAPTRAEIAALEQSTSSKAVQQLLAGAHGRALDLGCGNGKFTRLLAGLFTEVSGIDVKAGKIEEAKAAASEAGITIDFRVASAEAIPYPDASFDAVAFSNSLHHIPHPDLALAEAVRVLKPSGMLYVMEPVPSGNYHDATSLVNDETAVRTEAYRQVVRLAGRGLTAQSENLYRSRRTFESLEEWLHGQIDMDAKRKARYEAQPDEVRRRFENHADRDGGKFTFDQVFRVNLLKKSAT